MKGFLALVAVGAVAAATSVPAFTHPSRAATTTVVNVSGKEFRFILSRKSGPKGTFIFKFKNVGAVAHDFKIAGKKTPVLQPGKSATLRVKIAKAGRYRYLCTVPGHVAAGMKGTFIVR